MNLILPHWLLVTRRRKRRCPPFGCRRSRAQSSTFSCGWRVGISSQQGQGFVSMINTETSFQGDCISPSALAWAR